jgi:hypothetical protein
MSSRGPAFTIGRVAAIVTVAGLTALPFVSCSAGPVKVEFKGHEILRNSIPNVSDGKTTRDNKKLFEGDDAWLHWAYLLAAAAAVACVFVAGRGAVAAAGVGLLATIAFLVGFNSRISREVGKLGSPGASSKQSVGMSLEAGAYLTLIGFLVSGVSGATTGSSESRGRGGGPPPARWP